MKIKYALSVCYIFAVIACLTCPSPAGLKAVADETEYLAIFMEGKKVGHAIQSRVVSENKVTTSEEVSITVSRAAVPVTICHGKLIQVG